MYIEFCEVFKKQELCQQSIGILFTAGFLWWENTHFLSNHHMKELLVTEKSLAVLSVILFSLFINLLGSVYFSCSGEELEYNLKDLRPATDYHVR